MTNKLHTVKRHVYKHRTAYAVAATVTTLLALQVRNTKVLNAFLKEHDLFDEYYSSEEE